MEKTDENNIKKNHFLKDDNNKQSISKEHNDYFGYKTPDNFFSESKKEILNSISSIEVNEKKFIAVKPVLKWVAAASVVILIISMSYMFFSDSTFFNNNVISEDISDIDEDNMLLNSFFVDDSELDNFIENYIMEDIIIESELKTDHVIINSLMLTDEEAEQYIDEYLIEALVL